MKNSVARFQFFLRYLSLVLSVFVFFVTCMLVFRFFIVSPGRVNGRSMEPNFIDEAIFFVNKFVYLFSPPERYDLVQIIDPESKHLMIKRVIGLPNETVIIKRGSVYLRDNITGEENKINESAYLPKNVYTKVQAQTKPEYFNMKSQEYFMLGDNRPHSVDSRYYGPIHRSAIVGKVMIGDKPANLVLQK